MSTHKRKPSAFQPSFEGWSSYQEWADNGFQPRDTEDDASGAQRDEQPGAVATATAPSQSSAPGPGEAILQPSARWPEADADHEPEDEADPDFIRARPYVRTGGRARATYDLRLETMVSATGLHQSGNYAMRPRLNADQRSICGLCRYPQSVAEVAARIKAPLGVARILISDSIDLGVLMIHDNAPMANGRPPLELLRRVHDGLLRLA